MFSFKVCMFHNIKSGYEKRNQKGNVWASTERTKIIIIME